MSACKKVSDARRLLQVLIIFGRALQEAGRSGFYFNLFKITTAKSSVINLKRIFATIPHAGLTSVNTKCNYKIGQICEVIFYQDDENNFCIAIVMELFFEEVMIKKNEQIGLICSYIWYKS